MNNGYFSGMENVESCVIRAFALESYMTLVY